MPQLHLHFMIVLSIQLFLEGIKETHLKIQLEIGVKRMLQELPNQVIPSITVDETIALDSNSYKVTFSDSANSGDQHMLKCKVASCDTDGCQPRKKAIKGLYRSVLTSSGSSSTSSLASAATWATSALLYVVVGRLPVVPTSIAFKIHLLCRI